MLFIICICTFIETMIFDWSNRNSNIFKSLVQFWDILVNRMSTMTMILFSTVVSAATFTTQEEMNRVVKVLTFTTQEEKDKVVKALYTESDYAASLISLKYKEKNEVEAVMDRVKNIIEEIERQLKLSGEKADNLLKFKQSRDIQSAVKEQQQCQLLLINKKTELKKLKKKHSKKLMEYNETIRISKIKQQERDDAVYGKVTGYLG